MQAASQMSTPLQYSSVKGPADSPLSKHLLDFRLWLICGAFIVVGILSLNDTMLYTPDSPRYLIWAKSLAAFKGFLDTSNPDPIRYVIHAPLYPILLAPLAWFFNDIIIPSKVLTIIFGVALLVLFYMWTVERTSRSAALIGTFFLAINPLTVLFSSHVMSDISFVACIVLFIMLAEKMAAAPQEEKWAWMFVVVLTAGIFLREVGLTLLLGTLSYFWVRKEHRRLLLVFTIPMLFYLIWYFRNEVYIAGIENPPMRNMQMLLGHSFTGDNASLMQEFMARLRINITVYLRMGKGLILFPQYLVQAYGVVNPLEPSMAGMTSVLRIGQYPLILLQYGLFGWGILSKWKESKTTMLVVLFSGFYLFVVLLYPFNDVRFLLPIMVLVLYYAVVGGHDFARRLRQDGRMERRVVILAASLGVLVTVPNVVWIYNYVTESREYVKKLNDPLIPFVVEPGTPDLYAGPASLVGRWLALQAESSMPVIARWKELAFWMNGRKIIESDPLLSLTLFENLLRDYNVGYIVSLVTDPGLREFECQMLQSRRFGFTSAYRAGDLEVIKVHHLYRHMRDSSSAQMVGNIRSLPSTPEREENARQLYRQGVRLLESSRYEEAANIFNILIRLTHGSGYPALLRGIALEFSDHFDEASWLFNQFRYQVQAGPFLKHAWYHRMLINEIQVARQDSASKLVRAMAYHKVSANYWDLGYHRRAFEMIQQSLLVDTNFTPALIFGVYYSIQISDMPRAKRFFSRVEKSDSNHILINPIRRIFSLLDSVRLAKTITQRLACELSLAKGYSAIGVRDLAIDQTLVILNEDPNNLGALAMLAQMYDDKDRRAPAIQVLERLIALKPDDEAASKRLRELKGAL
jgi:tetratricopeptide (TPR) repeat protein/4-amino-4-deoxy-L-arabinose transferase-like glycosyltransferase